MHFLVHYGPYLTLINLDTPFSNVICLRGNHLNSSTAEITVLKFHVIEGALSPVRWLGDK